MTGTAGGIEAVVKAINAHIDDPIICETGCNILGNIALNSKQ